MEYTFYHLTQEGEDEDNRQFSIDRAECIPFPRPMIDNISHPYLKVWSNTRNGKERILIYHEQESYLVILEKRDDYALLWTAYPISRKHTYRKLMKEYEAYKKARTAEWRSRYSFNNLVDELLQISEFFPILQFFP